MRRLLVSLSAWALVTGFVTTPAASAQQSFNLYVGRFAPRTIDARTEGDVLARNADFLDFNVKDFSGATVGGEWLVGMGDFVEAGLGVGFYTRTVPSVYRDFVNSNGTEIDQDLKLRVVPFTATVRFLPLGHQSAVQPYVGAGVGIYSWRYSETGQFVDFTDRSIFRDTFVGSGSAVGPVVLGGIRVPVGPAAIGGEIRYQAATSSVPADQGFAGSKLDLGGMNYLFTVNLRF